MTHKSIHNYSVRSLPQTLIVWMLIFCTVLCCAGCGSSSGTETAASAEAPDLQALYDGMTQTAEFPEMFLLSPERVAKLYGIDTAACPQAIFATVENGLRIDEIWLVEAESEESAGKIEEIALGRVEQLKRETENSLPDQYAVAEKARVLRRGNVVALLVSPEAEALAALLPAG